MRVGWVVTLGSLAVVSLVAAGTRDPGLTSAPEVRGSQEAQVTGVGVDPQTRQPVLVLQGKRDKRNVAMIIGFFEAERIAIPLQGVSPPRPLTHDLIVTLLADLNASLRRIVITDLKDDVYYALLHLDSPGGALTVDSRPSDAVALALRAKVPIFVEDRVFDKAARVMPKPSQTPHF